MESSKTSSVQEETATAETATHEVSRKAPLWSRKLNRVKAAMWKHNQNGSDRYTIAIYRSYKGEKDSKWNNVYYFDRNDLQDIKMIVDEAEDKVKELENLVLAVDKA